MNAISKTSINEIVKLHEQLGNYVRKSVGLVWEIGKRLAEVKQTLDHGDFIPWIQENLPFNPRTARNYMAVYDRFPEGLPENMDLTQAYLESGVKRLAAPEATEQEPVGRLSLPDPQALARQILKMPVVSEAHLRYYRVAVSNGAINVVRPGFHMPRMVGTIDIDPVPGSEDAYKELTKTLQAAVEIYLSKREMLEENEVVAPLLDPSPIAMIKRAADKSPRKSRSA